MQQQHTTDYSDTACSRHENSLSTNSTNSNLATAILHTTQAAIDMKAHLRTTTETSPSTAAVSALSITLPAVRTPASNGNGNKIRGNDRSPMPSPLTRVATFSLGSSAWLSNQQYTLVYPPRVCTHQTRGYQSHRPAKNPYPGLGVWVFMGKGMGILETTRELPVHITKCGVARCQRMKMRCEVMALQVMSREQYTRH
jgi:hypothetical protein